MMMPVSLIDVQLRKNKIETFKIMQERKF
jgi:hypothetical protein